MPEERSADIREIRNSCFGSSPLCSFLHQQLILRFALDDKRGRQRKQPATSNQRPATRYISSMTRIAFLGTGLLGSAFVEAAAKRGEEITVWNRTAAKARALESLGVRVAKSPAE